MLAGGGKCQQVGESASRWGWVLVGEDKQNKMSGNALDLKIETYLSTISVTSTGTFHLPHGPWPANSNQMSAGGHRQAQVGKLYNLKQLEVSGKC